MKFYDKKPRELEQNPFTLPDNPAVIAARGKRRRRFRPAGGVRRLRGQAVRLPLPAAGFAGVRAARGGQALLDQLF